MKLSADEIQIIKYQFNSLIEFSLEEDLKMIDKMVEEEGDDPETILYADKMRKEVYERRSTLQQFINELIIAEYVKVKKEEG